MKAAWGLGCPGGDSPGVTPALPVGPEVAPDETIAVVSKASIGENAATSPSSGPTS
jgi:hypothetical protein